MFKRIYQSLREAIVELAIIRETLRNVEWMLNQNRQDHRNREKDDSQEKE